ncbi:MAG: hypothetical protein Q9219_004117 [cf. Caloplaca sp. 3 TL-2023]
MRNHPNVVQGQSYGRQLAEIHANAIPGATRDEEGEEGEEMLPARGMNHSPAQQALHRNYNDFERSRERERYEEYLDEQDSEKLPNAFDLGWRNNLRHLFGDKPLLWVFPFRNSIGDGWHWEPSQRWLEAREDLKRQREAQWHEQHQWGNRHDSRYAPAQHYDRPKPMKMGADDGSPKKHLDGSLDNDSVSSNMSLKTFRRRESFDEGSEVDEADDYEISSDEEEHKDSRYRDGWYGSSRPSGHTQTESEWKKWD